MPASRMALIGILICGCTTVLGIDDDYVVGGTSTGAGGSTGGAPPATGGTASGAVGAATSTGGSGAEGGTATGGVSAGGTLTDGSAPDGSALGCVDTGDCEVGRKCCGGFCILPSPEMGCSLTTCEPCGAPVPNAEPLCDNYRCSGRCKDGFVPGVGACVPEGTTDGGGLGGSGGAGPTGGSGGIAGSAGAGALGGGGATGCTRESCPVCLNPALGVVRCCDRFTDQCGCSWFEAAYCVE